MDLVERLATTDVIGHWDFVYDEDLFDVSGQFLALSDGTVLKRMSGSSSGSDETGASSTTWRYKAWETYLQWEGGLNAPEIIRRLQNRGYGLAKPSPVSPEKSEAGPFPGHPDLAKYL